MELIKPTCNSRPNILITGTPGVGKSYVCERLGALLKLRWLDVSRIANEKKFVTDYDKAFNCPILDEDKLIDYLEPLMQQGGNIIEYHGCSFFPERWFQVVFVVTCQHTILYDRLKNRSYKKKKLNSNVECEIFGLIFEEALESYRKDIVYELKGEKEQDMETNIQIVRDWYSKWETEQNISLPKHK